MSNQLQKYSGVYREMASFLSDATIRRIWEHMGGLDISFPKSLYSREYVHAYIRKNMDTKRPREIAKHVDLSERRVRQLISEFKKEEV
ncbi:MAG: hypothetical protein K5891_06850 [Lachnospiraceae bacterium]|nr:hypothetical protein [Lachnospiraceae bacterium]